MHNLYVLKVLEGLVGVSQDVVRFDVDPRGASSTSVARRCKLAVVAALAVKFLVIAIEQGVVVQGLLTRLAGGAPLVVVLAIGGYLLGTVHSTTTTRTVLLGFIRLDDGCVEDIVVDIRGANLWPVLLAVAFLAVETTVWSVIVGQTVKQTGAIETTKAIFMIPRSLGVVNMKRL
jgi:hypothetical protein